MRSGNDIIKRIELGSKLSVLILRNAKILMYKKIEIKMTVQYGNKVTYIPTVWPTEISLYKYFQKPLAPTLEELVMFELEFGVKYNIKEINEAYKELPKKPPFWAKDWRK